MVESFAKFLVVFPGGGGANGLHQQHQRGTGFNHDDALAVLHELGQLG